MKTNSTLTAIIPYCKMHVDKNKQIELNKIP